MHTPRAIAYIFWLHWFLFKNIHSSKENSKSAGSIFTKFIPHGRYFSVDCWLDSLFPMIQRTLPWQPILGSKFAKSDYLPLFVALAFRNRLQYRHSDFKMFIRDDMATLCVNLVNFGPATPEITRVKDVHPVVCFFKINPSDKLS